MSTFWSRWVAVASAIVFLFGLALVAAAEPMRRVFEEVYYVNQVGFRLGDAAASYTLFLQGVMGAVMMGWGTMLFLVAIGPFKKGDPSAWSMITASLVVWFVADVGISLWTGYALNAVLNAGLAILFVIPLVATFPSYRRAKKAAASA